MKPLKFLRPHRDSIKENVAKVLVRSADPESLTRDIDALGGQVHVKSGAKAVTIGWRDAAECVLDQALIQSGHDLYFHEKRAIGGYRNGYALPAAAVRAVLHPLNGPNDAGPTKKRDHSHLHRIATTSLGQQLVAHLYERAVEMEQDDTVLTVAYFLSNLKAQPAYEAVPQGIAARRDQSIIDQAICGGDEMSKISHILYTEEHIDPKSLVARTPDLIEKSDYPGKWALVDKFGYSLAHAGHPVWDPVLQQARDVKASLAFKRLASLPLTERPASVQFAQCVDYIQEQTRPRAVIPQGFHRATSAPPAFQKKGLG